jgi:hypothetical protein
MINFLQAQLSHLSAHTLGNKTNGEDLIASRAELELPDEDLRSHNCPLPFLVHLTQPSIITLHQPMATFGIIPCFNGQRKSLLPQDQFHLKSVSIAKHLYEVSVHPLIKSGDLFVAMFSNIQ